MKSMLGIRLMTMSGRRIMCVVLNRDRLGPPAPDPAYDLEPGHQDRREQRPGNAEAERHREAFHRSRTQREHQHARDEGGDVAVEDGAEGAAEARLQRREHGAPAPNLLAD